MQWDWRHRKRGFLGMSSGVPRKSHWHEVKSREEMYCEAKSRLSIAHIVLTVSPEWSVLEYSGVWEQPFYTFFSGNCSFHSNILTLEIHSFHGFYLVQIELKLRWTSRDIQFHHGLEPGGSMLTQTGPELEGVNHLMPLALAWLCNVAKLVQCHPEYCKRNHAVMVALVIFSFRVPACIYTSRGTGIQRLTTLPMLRWSAAAFLLLWLPWPYQCIFYWKLFLKTCIQCII